MPNEMPLARDQPHTLFEYLYRDAGNFKSRGSILLSGRLSPPERSLIESKMEGGEFFIAEQIGIKPLYEALYEFSGGMTQDDHVWHCFEAFHDVGDCDQIDDMECWGTTAEFVKKFARVQNWNLRFSLHAVLISKGVRYARG
jgi:hypothetical protein